VRDRRVEMRSIFREASCILEGEKDLTRRRVVSLIFLCPVCAYDINS
jgi:hypothetical protein